MSSNMAHYDERLRALRDELRRRELDGFVVPLTDEHMSEYVGGYAQRLAWLTGFRGSAGTAAILPTEAALFVDGRYAIQARQQVDEQLWQIQHLPRTRVTDWLCEHAQHGARIGCDPWLHTDAWMRAARS